MNRTRIPLIVSILLIVVVALLLWITHFLLMNNLRTLKLGSAAFADGGTIPATYTCTGLNISPPLSISGVPENTVSLALIVDDPDAPVGVWDHWIVFNMDKDTREIPENSQPHGTPGKGSSGETVYQGPCPPSGIHRYIFTLYALDTMLDIPGGSVKKDVVKAMNGHILAQAVLMGRYGK